MKKYFRLLGILATLVAMIYFFAFAIQHYGTMPKIQWQFSAYMYVGVAVVFYLATFALGGGAWYLLLRDTNEQVKLANILVIYSLSQFAKYIPGNVGHHIGRVALARDSGLKMTPVIFTMAIETGWIIVVSAFLAIAGLLMAGKDLMGMIPQVTSNWQILIVAIAAVLVPLLGAWTLNHWRPSTLRKLLGKEDIVMPGSSTLLSCFLLYSMNFFLIGLTINLLAMGLFNATGSSVLLLTGIYAIAWIAGFITPGAPAGLGVRDAILAATLTPLYGAGGALGLSVLLRVATIIGDGVAFSAALIVKKKVHSQSA